MIDGQVGLRHGLISLLMALFLSISTLVGLPVRSAPASPMLSDLNLPTYVWPATRPKGIVVGLHGGCLHGRAYDSLARALAARNYTFVSFDMRGYGKWYHDRIGTKRDTTFNYKRSLNDIEAVLTRLNQRCVGKPVFLIGESLGANIATLVAAQRPDLVDGVILASLSSPKLFLSPRMLGNAAQSIINPASKLNLRPYLANRLTNDRNELAAHFADPYSRDDQSVIELVKSLGVTIKGKRSAKKLPCSMPVLAFNGGQDRLTSIKRSRKLLRKVPLTDRTMVLFPDRGHLLVETKTVDPAILRMTTNWLDAHSNVGVGIARRSVILR